MNLGKWAEDLLEEVDKKHWSLKGNYNLWESGWGVFYSPVVPNPHIMIIGYNLGGGEEDFNRAWAKQIPAEHEYLAENYPLAVKMRKLFESINKLSLLQGSVKLNLIFFRSKDEKQWKSIDRDVRKDMETFCFSKVKEIINKLKPKIIITEGIETYDILTNEILTTCEEIKCISEKGRRIYCKSKCEDNTVIGLIHPTGARINDRASKHIKKSLSEDL